MQYSKIKKSSHVRQIVNNLLVRYPYLLIMICSVQMYNYSAHGFLYIGCKDSWFLLQFTSHLPHMKETSTLFTKPPHTGKQFSSIFFNKPLATDVAHTDSVHSAIIHITSKMLVNWPSMHSALITGGKFKTWYRKHLKWHCQSMKIPLLQTNGHSSNDNFFSVCTPCSKDMFWCFEKYDRQPNLVQVKA